MIDNLFQLSLPRIIQIYIGYGSIAAFFIYLAFKTLTQDKKRLNLYFSLLYLVSATGLIITFIYAPITDTKVATLLHYIAIYLILFSTIFLLVFNLIFLKTEKIFTFKKQIALIIIYGLFLILMPFIPNGVEISEATGWNPHWSWPLFIYMATILSAFSVIPAFYYSIQSYNKFEDHFLKKKWKFFILGMNELYLVIYGTFLVHAINEPLVRTVFAPISLILSITGAYFLYYGFAKKFKAK